MAIATTAESRIATTIENDAKRSEYDDEGETESRSHIDEAHRDECNEQRSAIISSIFQHICFALSENSLNFALQVFRDYTFPSKSYKRKRLGD